MSTNGKHKRSLTEIQSVQLVSSKEGFWELANRFFYEWLIPGIRDGTVSEPGQIVQLYHRFREENAGSGCDFELGVVLGIAWQQVLVQDCLLQEAPWDLPPNAVEVNIAYDLLLRTPGAGLPPESPDIK